MPSILSDLKGEKVWLEASDENPHRPPQEVLSGSQSRSKYPTEKQSRNSHEESRHRGINGKARSGVQMHGLIAEDSGSEDGHVQKHNSTSRDLDSSEQLNGLLSNGSDATSQHEASTRKPPTKTALAPSPKDSQHANGTAVHDNQWRHSSDQDQISHSWQKNHSRAHSSSAPQQVNPTALSNIQDVPSSEAVSSSPVGVSQSLKPAPPNKSTVAETGTGSSIASLHPNPPRLLHRHTLEVPRTSISRTSRDFSYPHTASESESGRQTPTIRTPRASNTIVRAPTRSIHSDMYLDEIPADSDMAKWTETVRQKRASRRKRKDEEEDDRVVVGTKVDINHVNWVTAYNMLTGIRFTVSRTHAKIDRELTDADFDARHKFSFDITGNELTPSAKYDFKFKDYAPWVFRHLRARFHIDPADYLMSLTSKYILSELGSPGKSGSFFYFSRDYKYIIKTIHHAEHTLLRKILREYYNHIEKHPNTLISQFYGLHRVKIPYGRKIHFVVMNNLFPPHRDIHQTFDLKGSTIGRDFREEDLSRNPRATLKDLNWLRRDYHFEFGPQKKTLFVEQMKRDVALLQKLKIMDYSLLVGIHDLNRGNEENLRDKTLRVFEPGGDDEKEAQAKLLTRVPSKLENVRQAKQLREIIKKEKPVPMDQSTSKMPEEMLEERKNFIFYGDDGGFMATHEDGTPGEEIYYLGVIDCLTHYGLVKRVEHLWKGMSNNKSQISPVPPDAYGTRFVKFISGLTKTKEEVDREINAADQLDGSTTPSHRQPSWSISRKSTDKVIEKAEKQAQKSEKEGASEDPGKDRTLTARHLSADKGGGGNGATLPVVQEDTEGSREASIRDEKSQSRLLQKTSQTSTSNRDTAAVNATIPNIPPLQRLSLGLGPTTKVADDNS